MPSVAELNKGAGDFKPVIKPTDKLISAGVRNINVGNKQIPFGVIEFQRGETIMEVRRPVVLKESVFSSDAEVIVKENAPKDNGIDKTA